METKEKAKTVEEIRLEHNEYIRRFNNFNECYRWDREGADLSFEDFDIMGVEIGKLHDAKKAYRFYLKNSDELDAFRYSMLICFDIAGGCVDNIYVWALQQIAKIGE